MGDDVVGGEMNISLAQIAFSQRSILPSPSCHILKVKAQEEKLRVAHEEGELAFLLLSNSCHLTCLCY